MIIARRYILVIVAVFTFHGLPSAVAQEEPEPPDVSQASVSPEEQASASPDEQASVSPDEQAGVSPEDIEKYEEVKKAAKKETVDEDIKGNKTGTDPRDFSNKWMPFYRYTKLANGLRQHDFTAMGTFAFTPRLGMFYELPLARYRDFSNVAGLPAGAPANAIGLGDMNLKMLATPEAFEFTYPSPKTPKLPSKEGKMRGNVLVGMDMTFPTATDDALASNAFVLAPILALVMDLPLYGFVALLNLYFFDVYKTDGAPEVSRYVGRWFFMQPLTPPGEWWGGFYLLPEFQPAYDFIANDFSIWIAPEVGKMLSPGKILYLKPGWGISNSEPTDRKFTVEAGYRWFF